VDSVRNLVFSGMHTTFFVSLRYLVKYKYPKKHTISTGLRGVEPCARG